MLVFFRMSLGIVLHAALSCPGLSPGNAHEASFVPELFQASRDAPFKAGTFSNRSCPHAMSESGRISLSASWGLVSPNIATASGKTDEGQNGDNDDDQTDNVDDVSHDKLLHLFSFGRNTSRPLPSQHRQGATVPGTREDQATINAMSFRLDVRGHRARLGCTSTAKF